MKAGENLEKYIQYVYSKLLELNDYEDVIVSRNITIQGKSGATNEFDVFYQFKHLNIECKVVIECKDWKSPVSIGHVRDFASKIEDVGMGQFLGVMVSKNGYQDGAKMFAKSKGITLLTEKEIPSLSQLLSGIIQKAFLPNKNTKGDPFWTLMEVNNGKTTGTYYACKLPKLSIPLFYSKEFASRMLCNLPDAKRFEVRGISQYQLKGLIAQMKVLNVSAVVYCLPYWNEYNTEIPLIEISAQQLEKEYLY